MDICFCSPSQRVEGTGVEGRHSCQNHVDKTGVSSAVGSIPALSQTFFSIWTFLKHGFLCLFYYLHCDGTYFGVLL